MNVCGIECRVNPDLPDGEYVFYERGVRIAGGNINDSSEWQDDPSRSLAVRADLYEVSQGAFYHMLLKQEDCRGSA